MATFLNDTFTDTDATELSAHTGETGATWTKHGSYSPDADINSNALEGQSDTDPAVYYASGSPSSADYYVEGVINHNNSSTNRGGFAARIDTAADTMYVFAITGNKHLFYRIVAGSITSLTDTNPYPGLTDHTYKFTVETTDASTVRLEAYMDGSGTPFLTYDDTDASRILGAGKAGFYQRSALAPIKSISAVDLAVSNSITITDLDDDRVYQRTGTNTDITIAGTYSGSPTAIQARVMDGVSEEVTWTSIDASPTGGTFSGTISTPTGGPFTAEVRFSNDTGVTDEGTNGWLLGDVIMISGQSNAAHWFDADTTGTPNASMRILEAAGWRESDGVLEAGAVEFANTYITTEGVPCGMVLSATGSLGLRHEAAGTAYLDASDLRGAAYATWITARLTDTDNTLGGFVWIQGEQDAADAGVTEAEYEGSLNALLGFVRADVSDASLPVVIAYLGRYTGATDANVQAINNAQQNVVASDANAYGVMTHDIAYDGVHYDDHKDVAARVVEAMLYAKGSASYYEGPTITGATKISSTVIDVNITHESGTDFTPTSAITGFSVLDDATPATISSAVRQDATTIRLTLASALTGTATVRYLYGASPTITSLVKDNTANTLPLVFDGDINLPNLISITLVDTSDSAQTSLTGLKYAFFDYATPDLIAAAPSVKGTTETTDGSGALSIDVTASGLTAGQDGWLIVTDSDGDPATIHNVFSGPVEVVQ